VTVASPSRLVVLSPNWLGDAVMALPALADARRHWPEARITVAARGGLAALFGAVPHVDAVISLDAAPPRLSVAADAARLHEGAHDVALLFPNAFRAAFVAWRARIRERWGYATDRRGWLLTRRVDPPGDARIHQADYYRHLTSGLGIPQGPRHPVLRVPDGARAAARRLLERDGWRGEPIVGLAPGAAYGSAKRWLPDRVGALAARIATELGARTAIVGALADRGTADEVIAAAAAAGAAPGAVIDLTSRTDLPTLMGVLATCAAFVSNDSGAMHLAAALDVPVIAVFGPTREWATAPLAGPAGRDATIVLADVDCRPCMLRTCPIDHRCMTRITVDDVFEPVARALGERGRA
jgi:heptosyltransferase-2